MSVWLCIPSKRPPAEAEKCLRLWRERGYRVALWRDDADGQIGCDMLRGPQAPDKPTYPGYARATNEMIAAVLQADRECDWVVCGGDDTEPDHNHRPEEIAQQCSEHFYNSVELAYPPTRQSWAEIPVPSPGGSGKDSPSYKRWSTFGIMQPTGDRYAGRSIDRICGSPWIGREFALRINGGKGPFWPEYRHMFPDEELQEVAKHLGVLWQRPDLVHLHHHFMRQSPDLNSLAVAKPIPDHLIEANSPEHWAKYQALFLSRKQAGFPGHEPRPA